MAQALGTQIMTWAWAKVISCWGAEILRAKFGSSREDQGANVAWVYFWLAGKQGMEKKMETTIRGNIGLGFRA